MRKIIIALTLLAACVACNNAKKENKNEEESDMKNSVQTFQAVNPKEINENAIQLIGDKWMLVTAGDSARFNMMTASWGCMGYLWNKPVVFIFIRPERYTYGFIEENPSFTLSFFGPKYREALKICGTVSGRDVNKVEESGLTPYFTPSGNVSFNEAYLVLECKKLYAEPLNPEAFIDKEILASKYSEEEGGLHKVYVAEIVNAWEKK